MGIYDRDYYRRDTLGSPWLTGQTPATTALVIVTVLVFAAQMIGRSSRVVSIPGFPGPVHQVFDPVTQALALAPDQVFERFQLWRLVTAAFCHGGFWHLLWNMLWLWWFGSELEKLYGSREFLIFYLTAAVVASTAWAVASLGSSVPMVGASGAVSAVIVVFTLYYPRQQIYIYGILPVEMRWFVLVMFGGDAFLLIQQGNYSPVAHMAHLGGAAYGLAYKLGDLRVSRLFRPRTARTRLRVVVHDPEPSVPGLDESLEHRLDQILAKISRDGPDSLSEEEREILDRASRKLRDRRG